MFSTMLNPCLIIVSDYMQYHNREWQHFNCHCHIFSHQQSFIFDLTSVQEPEQGIWKIRFRSVSNSQDITGPTFHLQCSTCFLVHFLIKGCQEFERRGWIWSVRICPTKGRYFRNNCDYMIFIIWTIYICNMQSMHQYAMQCSFPFPSVWSGDPSTSCCA